MSTTSSEGGSTSATVRAWDSYRRVRGYIDHQVAEPLERSAGISLADFDVLQGVRQATTECVRVSGLADDIGWSRSRLSRQLSRLERRGLVAREPCERDGRGDDVLLTDEGREVIDRAEPVHREAVRSVLESSAASGLFAAMGSFAQAIDGRG